MPVAALTTLGCKVNQWETERIAEDFARAGFVLTSFDSPADVYVINKSDLPTAAKSASDIQRILSLTHRAPDAWVPPVLSTSQKDASSIVQLSEAIDADLSGAPILYGLSRFPADRLELVV